MPSARTASGRHGDEQSSSPTRFKASPLCVSRSRSLACDGLFVPVRQFLRVPVRTGLWKRLKGEKRSASGALPQAYGAEFHRGDRLALSALLHTVNNEGHGGQDLRVEVRGTPRTVRGRRHSEPEEYESTDRCEKTSSTLVSSVLSPVYAPLASLSLRRGLVTSTTGSKVYRSAVRIKRRFW